MGACGSSHADPGRKKRKKKGSKHTAAVAPLVHQIAFIGFMNCGKEAAVRHFVGRVADMREAAETSHDRNVQNIADAWSVGTKKQGKPDYFGAPTFNVRVSNMPISLHDVPHDQWRTGTEEAHAYLWTMSGAVLVLDGRAPDLYAAARAAVDEALEARCPLLVILNNIPRTKADAIGALGAFSRGFGLDATPLACNSWAVDIHYAVAKVPAAVSSPASGAASGDTAAGSTDCWCCGDGWPTTVGTNSVEGGSNAVEIKDGDLPSVLQGGKVLTSFPPEVFFDSSPGAPPGTPHLCKGMNWLLRTVAKGGTM